MCALGVFVSIRLTSIIGWIASSVNLSWLATIEDLSGRRRRCWSETRRGTVLLVPSIASHSNLDYTLCVFLLVDLKIVTISLLLSSAMFEDLLAGNWLSRALDDAVLTTVCLFGNRHISRRMTFSSLLPLRSILPIVNMFHFIREEIDRSEGATRAH